MTGIMSGYISDNAAIALLSAVMRQAREDYIIAEIMEQQYGKQKLYERTIEEAKYFLYGRCRLQPLQFLCISANKVLDAWELDAVKIMNDARDLAKKQEGNAQKEETTFVTVEFIKSSLRAS